MRRSPKPAAAAFAAALFCSAAFAGTFSGCSVKPTFPPDRLPESIVKISKQVHGIDVQADLEGKTLGILWTTDTLMDETGRGIAPVVMDRIGELTSSVSRVALSTDRPIEYVIVAVRGIKEKTEFQVIRSVDDIRRAYAEALSIPESMNRTLQYTKAFEVESEEAGAFHTGNWTQEDFIAKLILQRVRMAKPIDPENPIPTELYDGKYYLDEKGSRVFEFAVLTLKKDDSNENIATVLRMIREVFGGYRYDNFDQIVIRDLIHQKQLVIGRSTMKIFEANKITEEELISTRLVADTGRTNALKNALEVFGFNVS